MNTSDCKILLTLLEEGRITSAADRLYTSQSTLSYRIKSLENELGCILFERDKSGVTPTQDCRLVADFARETLTGYEALIEQFSKRQISVEKSETLMLGVVISIVPHLFNSLQRNFQKAYPHIELSLFANSSKTLVSMLEEEVLDIAITRGDVEWSGKKDFLFEEPMYLVSRRPINPKKLSDSPFLVPPISRDHDMISRWVVENCGKLPKNIVESESIDAIVQLVNQDIGFAILPAMSLVGKKNLVRKKVSWQNGQPLLQKTWLLYREDPNSRAFLDLLNFIKSTLPKNMASILQEDKEK